MNRISKIGGEIRTIGSIGSIIVGRRGWKVVGIGSEAISLGIGLVFSII